MCKQNLNAKVTKKIANDNQKKRSPKTPFFKSISGILFLVAKVIVISLGLSLPTDSSNLPSRLGRAALRRRCIWSCSP